MTVSISSYTLANIHQPEDRELKRWTEMVDVPAKGLRVRSAAKKQQSWFKAKANNMIDYGAQKDFPILASRQSQWRSDYEVPMEVDQAIRETGPLHLPAENRER
ncbi:hypothetical protein MKZ38_004439 [Zalerion maritima]|uniref:Uncharacterized protein n=1 Tax=Zalerion maritima TaxID=339359 RepID=A0AAD5WV16_9PEZI|nr:hypothetical protein MKZ38_004439 [Zalerion maritima]